MALLMKKCSCVSTARAPVRLALRPSTVRPRTARAVGDNDNSSPVATTSTEVRSRARARRSGNINQSISAALAQPKEDVPVWVRREAERKLQEAEGNKGELPWAASLSSLTGMPSSASSRQTARPGRPSC